MLKATCNIVIFLWKQRRQNLARFYFIGTKKPGFSYIQNLNLKLQNQQNPVTMVPNLKTEDASSISTISSTDLNVYSLFDELRQTSLDNVNFFHSVTNQSDLEKKFERIFGKLAQNIDTVRPMYDQINNFAHEYDFDTEHPANGFRSFLYVVDRCIQMTQKVANHIAHNRSSMGFTIKRYQYVKEIESCNLLLENLINCLDHLIILRGWTDQGDLFPNSRHSAKELLMRAHKIDQYSFYGRCLGFQYCKTMRPALQFISTSMAGFSKAFYHDGNTLTKSTVHFYNSGKYFFDAEARAKRIVNISQNAGVDFCKAFWFLAENRFMYSLPAIAGLRVKINRVFQIPPEPLQAFSRTKNILIDIPVPSSHIGPGPVKVRLISNIERVGMVGETSHKSKPQPPSDTIIIHCHGGGFIACSSASHENYLREWSVQLGVPILSIDYSLAPKAPFPRALEEIFYTYCWVQQNGSVLGTNCKRIILAGDSAGANLSLGCALKCIETGIRPPDGIFIAYCPTMVDFIPSPARLLCLMDPLLPFGFMMQCLKAYSHPSLQIIERNQQIVERQNSIKYAGRKANGEGNNNTPDTSPTIDDEHHVQNFKKKYGSGDPIPVYENCDSIRFDQRDDNVVIEVGKEVCEESLNFKQRLGHIGSTIQTKLMQLTHRHPVGSKPSRRSIEDLDNLMAKSASEEFTFRVPADPYMSPYTASDEVLKKLPAVKIVSTNLDPCLDDCIMFGKRLKKLENKVHLDVITGLPHGFLNFTLLSKEAHDGNKLCIQKLQELVDGK